MDKVNRYIKYMNDLCIVWTGSLPTAILSVSKFSVAIVEIVSYFKIQFPAASALVIHYDFASHTLDKTKRALHFKVLPIFEVCQQKFLQQNSIELKTDLSFKFFLSAQNISEFI